MSNTYEMNSQASQVIEKARIRQAVLKKQAVEELLGIVNRICEQEGTSYFAVGDLLTLGMTGTDSDPERTCAVSVRPWKHSSPFALMDSSTFSLDPAIEIWTCSSPLSGASAIGISIFP